VAYQVSGSRVEWNPTAARLRELTEEMPNASVTEFGNVNVKARVDSRSTRSTCLVDDSTNSRGQTITRTEYDRVAAIQDAHIAESRMVVVDGYIGSDPQFRTRARLIMEAANANVAGMQQQPRRLYERQGRMDEHEAMVARLKQERKEFLGSFPGLDDSLVSSLG
jgi:phosphoenolpyruvate carboxykinase (ATP)